MRGSARIYEVRMAQFVLKIEQLSQIIERCRRIPRLSISVPDYSFLQMCTLSQQLILILLKVVEVFRLFLIFTVVVKGEFEAHFVLKKNVVFEREKFKLTSQQDSESDFITDFYCLVE